MVKAKRKPRLLNKISNRNNLNNNSSKIIVKGNITNRVIKSFSIRALTTSWSLSKSIEFFNINGFKNNAKVSNNNRNINKKIIVKSSTRDLGIHHSNPKKK